MNDSSIIPAICQDTTQDDHDLDTFFKWERASRDTIDVKKIYIDMAGDLVAGIVLSQLIYWHLPDERGHVRLRVQKGGKKWLAKARHEWWDECRVSPKQVDRALKILAGKGLIEVITRRFNGAPTKHIRIVPNVFIKAWDELRTTPTKNPFLPNGENPISPKGEIQFPQTVKSVTETTAETTAEKKDIAPANADAQITSLSEVDAAIYSTPEAATQDAVTPQAIAAMIKAWLDASGAIDSGAYGKKGYRKIAGDLAKAGITPEQVTHFVEARRKDTFWRDKTVTLAHVAQNIRAWLDSQRAPRVYAHPSHKPFDYEEPGDPGAAFEALCKQYPELQAAMNTYLRERTRCDGKVVDDAA